MLLSPVSTQSGSQGSSLRGQIGFHVTQNLPWLLVALVHIDLDTMLAAARRFKQRDDVRFLVRRSRGAEGRSRRDPGFRGPGTLSGHRLAGIGGHSGVLGGVRCAFLGAVQHYNELDKMRFQTKLYEVLGSGMPTFIGVDGLMSEGLDRTETGIM